MPNTENNLSPSTEKEKAPLSSWQRWLEFLQVVAVLIIAGGVALPFAVGLRNVGAWLGAITLTAIGISVAYLALDLIDPDALVTTHERYEITPARLMTLDLTGTPPDIVCALRDMVGSQTNTLECSAITLRDAFYSRLGEKRGSTYLPRILPYLAVYRSGDVKARGTVVTADDTSIRVADTQLNVDDSARTVAQ